MWNESQRVALARITEGDRQAAMQTARRHMDRRYRDMLDAGADDDDDSDWEWAAAAALGLWLFRGRPVAPPAVAGQLSRVMTGLEGEARAASLNGVAPVGTWALQIAALSKATALIAGAFAVGGWARIDPAIADVESFVAAELGYLDGFADDVAAGRVPRDGRFIRRAILYGAAGWGFYMLMRGRRARDRGYDEERSNLDPGAEHCAGCVAEADKGWQPIGSLVPIGDRQCRSNCRCHLQYRNRAGEVAE